MTDAPTLDLAASQAATVPVTIVPVRRVVALMNAGAGAFNQKLAAEIESELASSFAHRGVAATIGFVEGEDLRAAAEKALKQAKRGEIDAVVVGGGDGSIRTVASVLAGTSVPLGVLPLGTLNHFAKDLGLPLHVDEAAGTIAAGQVRVVDLAEVNGHTFINNSSIGIYPYMVIDRERRRANHRLAKWMAMVPAFFRMLGISRGGACASRRRASPSPTARPACSSATTNTAPSCSPSASASISIAASSGSTW